MMHIDITQTLIYEAGRDTNADFLIFNFVQSFFVSSSFNFNEVICYFYGDDHKAMCVYIFDY